MSALLTDGSLDIRADGMEPFTAGKLFTAVGHYAGFCVGERGMGFTWVAADASHFAAVEAWQPPAFTPRHRRPPGSARAVHAAVGLPRSLLARSSLSRTGIGAAAPAHAGLRVAP
jgi:hypothetical protein